MSSDPDPDVWFGQAPVAPQRLSELTRRLAALRERGASATSNGEAPDDDHDAPVGLDIEPTATEQVVVDDTSSEARRAEPFAAAPVAVTAHGNAGTGLILISLAVLVVIRFFTEIVPILPRPVQFIDIPIFLVIVVAAILRPHHGGISGVDNRKLTPILVLGLLFLAVCAGSTLTNLTRVDLAPALVFLYGFLGPLALCLAVYRMWPTGSSSKLSRLLVGLGILQVGVAFVIDLPLFLADGNPDVFSGTFGENAYQLVFFLLVLIGLLTGIYSFEKRRAVTRFVPVLLVAMVAIIFLAQYRSLLLTMAITVLMLGALLIRSGGRGIVAATLAAASLLGTLAYAVQNIPALKFGSTIDQAREDPTFYLEKRLETAGVVLRLFADEPRYTFTGTGPGTYSSRAWRTFAVVSPSDEDLVGDEILVLTGGRRYSTDVADKYVVPQLASEVVGGSRAVTTPLSSYLSLLAETGVVGFALMIAAYVVALASSLRMTLITIRTALPGDPLPALLCATTVAFFVLLQMAVLENWLEVTRLTFLTWIMFAVVTKEFRARPRVA